MKLNQRLEKMKRNYIIKWLDKLYEMQLEWEEKNQKEFPI